MGPGRAVLDWRDVDDPSTLIYDMWSHAAPMDAIGWGEGRRMHQRMLEQGISWPQLSAQDIADVVAYLNSPSQK